MAKDTGNVTDLGGNNDQQGGRTAEQIKAAAEKVIQKGRADALQAKLGELTKKRAEHTRSVNQIDEEIAREMAAYEKGL